MTRAGLSMPSFGLKVKLAEQEIHDVKIKITVSFKELHRSPDR